MKPILLAIKSIRAFESCKTTAQLEVARKFADLARPLLARCKEGWNGVSEAEMEADKRIKKEYRRGGYVFLFDGFKGVAHRSGGPA